GRREEEDAEAGEAAPEVEEEHQRDGVERHLRVDHGGDPSRVVDAQEAAADLVVDAYRERDRQHWLERQLGGEHELLEDGGRQPAGQPAELLASVLPEEGAGLAGTPEAGRLADQPRRRIARHGCAQERELVDQRRRLRVLEEGRRRRLAGGQVARAALALAL